MFNRKCALIGALHVHALPGSAGYAGNVQNIVDAAVADAQAYLENGVDALIIENMHDVPYLLGYVEPETVAAMTMVAQAVRAKTELPIGIQLLAGANIEALGVAIAASLDFLRVEGYVFAHVGDEGIHEACAAKLIRRRAELKANHIKIFADIKKKHSAHAITSDVSLIETAHAAEFFQADGVVVTGAATAVAPPPADVAAVKGATKISVLVGSGVTHENMKDYTSADGLIVGSSLKFDGKWHNRVDPKRVKALATTLQSR
jgi:uncharacterized protein